MFFATHLSNVYCIRGKAILLKYSKGSTTKKGYMKAFKFSFI